MEGSSGNPLGMSFSREQAHAVIDEFIALFNSDSFKAELKAFDGDESKIVQAIDDRQSAIFTRHGVDPKKGFADLRRIKQAYNGDVALIQKAVFAASKEELTVNEALGMQVPDTAPKNVQQFQQAISGMPQAFAMMQQRLQANPELMAQMNPAQQQQVQQMMMMYQQMRMMNMMGGMGMGGAPQEINSDAALMNVLLTPTGPNQAAQNNNNMGMGGMPGMGPNMGMGGMGMGGMGMGPNMGMGGMGMPGMAPGRVSMNPNAGPTSAPKKDENEKNK